MAYIVLTATIVVNAGPEVGFPNDEEPEQYKQTCEKELWAGLRDHFPNEGDTESITVQSTVIG
jgi:hypothetical protein